MKRPCIIGIAGGSCSGKSTFAHLLAEQLGPSATILPIDAYYRDLSAYTPEERAVWNFDAPEAIEHDLLIRDVSQLAVGCAINRPEYDFAQHTRAAATFRVEPGDYILLEGLFALYWEPIRKLLATKLFIDAPDAVSLARRTERDVRERGRTEASVERQYADSVRPMYTQFCAPTRQHADLILQGEDPVDYSVAKVLQLLAQCQKGGG